MERSGLRDGTAREAGFDPERLERARVLARRWVGEGHTPSLAVLAARRGVVALEEAFGGLAPGGPALERDSIFPVASVSKTVNAALVMALVEDGLLGLSRPITDYLPEITGDGKDQVLVAHLLSHVSGFEDETLDTHALAKQRAGFEPGPPPPGRHPFVHGFLAPRSDAPLWKRPGEQMSYCDYNFELLGEIVRVVSGESLEAYSRRRLFDPLGMDDTSWMPQGPMLPRIVKRPPDAPLAAPTPPYFPGLESPEWLTAPVACGGLYSTARDLATFAQMVLDRGRGGAGRVLSRPTIAAMIRDQNPGIGCEFPPGVWHRQAGYGFGWIVETDEKWVWGHGSLPSRGSVYHQGAGGALLWVDLVHEVVGVWLGVTLEISEHVEQYWNADLFQNVVTAAVCDD